MDKLQGVLERKVRQLASSVLGHPQSPALDRPAETGVRVRLRGHERMFLRPYGTSATLVIAAKACYKRDDLASRSAPVEHGRCEFGEEAVMSDIKESPSKDGVRSRGNVLAEHPAPLCGSSGVSAVPR